MTVWPLAKMSTPFVALTALLYLLPLTFFALALSGVAGVLLWPAVLVVLLYGLCWMLMRPRCFRLHDNRLEIAWPWRRRLIPLHALIEAELIDGVKLKQRLGLAARIGVGGLWGVFGILASRKAGKVSTWISRHDQLVWLAFSDRPPLLITPENPEQFVAALRAVRDQLSISHASATSSCSK